jgi:hypothetical protein
MTALSSADASIHNVFGLDHIMALPVRLEETD